MDPYVKCISNRMDGVLDWRNPDAFRRDLYNLPAVNKLRFAIDQALACSYLFWLYGEYDEFLVAYSEWLKDFIFNHLSKYEDEFKDYAASKMFEDCKNITYSWHGLGWIDVSVNDILTFVYRAVLRQEVRAPLALYPEMAGPYMSFRNSLVNSVTLAGAVLVPNYRVVNGTIQVFTAVSVGSGFNKDLPMEMTDSACYKQLLASASSLNATFPLFLARCSLTGVRCFEHILRWFEELCHVKDISAVCNGNTRLFYATHAVFCNTFYADFIGIGRNPYIRTIGRANEEGVGCILLSLLSLANKFFGVQFKSKDLFIKFFGTMRLSEEQQLAVEFVSTYGTGDCKAEMKAAAESLDISCEAINLISQTTTTSLAQVRGTAEMVDETEVDDQEENLDLSDLPDLDKAEPGLEAEEEEDTVTDGDESPESDDSSSGEGDQTGDNADQQSADDPGEGAPSPEDPSGSTGPDPTQTSDMQGSGKREDIDASDDDGLVFEVSPEGTETVDSVIIREEIDKFLTDILVNPPKKLSPQAVSVLTKLQKNWVHILSVKTIVGILERVVSVPEKFKNIKSDKE